VDRLYAAVIVGTCQKQKLEEDLANKPTESSNQGDAANRWPAYGLASLYENTSIAIRPAQI